jgi:hypothetical protein
MAEGELKMKVLQNSQIVRIIPILVAVCLVTVPTEAKYGGGAGLIGENFSRPASVFMYGRTAFPVV